MYLLQKSGSNADTLRSVGLEKKTKPAHVTLKKYIHIVSKRAKKRNKGVRLSHTTKRREVHLPASFYSLTLIPCKQIQQNRIGYSDVLKLLSGSIMSCKSLYFASNSYLSSCFNPLVCQFFATCRGILLFTVVSAALVISSSTNFLWISHSRLLFLLFKACETTLVSTTMAASPSTLSEANIC